MLGTEDSAIFDVYEIGDLLGSGAFGQVRKCRVKGDVGEVEEYAVKIVDLRSDTWEHAGAYLTAREEADILQMLRHPNVVELVDVFEDERFLYVVMEQVICGELFQALADPSVVVQETDIAVIATQLIGALDFLHQRHIVHRDVKAENILLGQPSEDSRWNVKLVDFGIAVRLERGCPMRRNDAPLELLCGTPYYCAPELYLGNYGCKVDLWAAGVVFYLALLGAYPFYSPDPQQLEALICSRDTEPSFTPSVAVAGYTLSVACEELLSGLLNKDPDQRLTAAAALKLKWLCVPKRRSSGGPHCSEGVPVALRAKAGRIAERAPVSERTERARTVALQKAMQDHAEDQRSARTRMKPWPPMVARGVVSVRSSQNGRHNTLSPFPQGVDAGSDSEYEAVLSHGWCACR